MQGQRSACDACRRRKVGCDSEQPCRQCAERGLRCTYGSSRRRGLGTLYVRSLEQQVAELQQQLQSARSEATERVRTPSIDLLVHSGGDLIMQQSAGTRIYRFSAALNILRTVADMATVGMVSPTANAPPGVEMVEAIDAPLQIAVGSAVDWLEVLLPSQDKVHHLVTCAIDRALVCHQCFDPQVFHARVAELYRKPSSRSKGFMASLYAALALGERYIGPDEGSSEPPDSLRSSSDAPDALPSGFQYFRASRCISHADLDPCELDQVIARILQARYLLSISHVSETHSTICKGIAVATHIGLHLPDSALQTRYSDAELDGRRMAFAVLYMMDVYISFILGLPRTLGSAHPTQTLGLPSNDLHDQGRSFLARNPGSPFAETVMAQKVFQIYAKMLDHQFAEDEEALMNSEFVESVQRDFEAWESLLPDLPSEPSDKRILLGQVTLRMQYIGAQIVFYAPCIHHLSRTRSDPTFNVDGFTYGSDCVRAAAQYILLAEILETQNLIVPATSWMLGFVLTLATSVLTYFVMYSKTRVTIEENKMAIMKAGRMLATLGESSKMGQQIYNKLSPYIDIVLNYGE